LLVSLSIRMVVSSISCTAATRPGYSGIEGFQGLNQAFRTPLF
jgi:hypothetical protein